MSSHESELLELKNLDRVERPSYTDEEEKYLAALKKRLRSAKDQRDQNWDEFDGMDYLTNYEANERVANTFIAPKKNREDTNFQSGIVRQKLFALLAALTNLNLRGDISAYDKESLKIQSLGDAMEDIIAKTNELDSDEEKQFLRFYELLKHGTVFVEEVWLEQKRKHKKLKKAFDGTLSSAKWDEQIKEVFSRPTRNVIPGTNVYLGDMTKYDVSDQPFLFTVETKPYDEAGAVFGKWDRWKNVPRELREVQPNEKESGYGTNWRLLEAKKNQVEVIRYQDKWNNEFAVVCNGILMTPVGLPLPFGFDDYTITQQNLEPIHSKFAYGKSLVARIKNKAALLDEFMRLGVLKTQKAFMPPYINLSGRMLTSRVLMPGKISHGIPRDSLVPINDKETEGVTTAELNMIREVQESINGETVSPTFAGQQASGDPTATEIIELQRQARMVLGLTILAATLLEWKLTWKRLKNIISNWFKETEEVVGDELKSKYEFVGVDALVEGEGQGRRVIVPTRYLPSPEAIFKAEKALAMEQGMPIRLVFLNPDELSLTKLFWQVTVIPKEKKSSEVEKLIWRSFMADAQTFGPLLNLDYLAERFSSVWGEDPSKLFKKQKEVAETGQGTSPLASTGVFAKDVLPTAESLLTSRVKSGLTETQ